jgi:long-chain acyl-CoA synthetase
VSATPLLADMVAERPAAVAVHDPSGATTWAELDRRVQGWIGALRGAGLAEGDAVVAMLGNQVELVELSLACLQGGWLLVPLNWHWVADEVRYVLDDAGASAVVVDARWADVVRDALDAAEVAPVCVVVGDAAVPGALAAATFLGGTDRGIGRSTDHDGIGDAVRGGPMFYTSGTTGRPKGVRGSLAQLGGPPEIWQLMAHSIRPVIELPEQDAVQLICGPMYHSAQWVISMFALICGAQLVLQHRFDADELLELIDGHDVTNVHLVPTQMSRLVGLDDERRERFDGASLRSVLHGAAPCPPSVKRSMIEWWGPIVTEYYGGTEGGFITTIGAADWLERPTSVGRPLEVVEVLVVDDEGRTVPAGTTGNLYFRSLLGSRFEYHGAPEKTEAAHLQPGVATLGDIGHLDEDGYLHLSDRRIDMIVSGGVNIYPAEIEAVLVGAGPVVDAAVFGIPDDEMGESVRAAVVLADDASWDDATEAEVVAHCRALLAGYKCPRSFEVHGELPRSAAGKLLKRSLRDPWWQDRERSI